MNLKENLTTDRTYLLANQSLRMATASATSLTPNIFRHCAAVSEEFISKVFLPHDTTTWPGFGKLSAKEHLYFRRR